MNKPTTLEPSLLSVLAEHLPELEGAKKNSNNPHFKSKYADLGAVIDAIRPMAEHGVWFRQIDLEREGGAAVETFYIGHGEELSAGITFVPADRGNAQGYGSAKTYARRYGLQNAFGLSSEDDDGNAAAAAPPKRQEKHSKLKTKIRELVREIHGVGDWDTWVVFRETDNFQAVTTDCEEKLPGWWEGWPEQPDGFTPLRDLIENKEREFAQEKAGYVQAG